MLLRSALAAAGMLLATTFHVTGQDSIPWGKITVDLSKTTEQYKFMFEKTCFRQRHSLHKFVTERPTPEYEMVPRQYPYHDDLSRRTWLAEWEIFTRSGPYSVVLYNSNQFKDITTCALYSVTVQKNAIKNVMSQIDGLYFVDEKVENETKIIGFMHKKELNLRVLCMMPIEEEVSLGECHLWSWTENGS